MKQRFWSVLTATTGQVIDVLLDAEVSPINSGNGFAYAALYDGHDPKQRQQASTTIAALRQLTRVRRTFESVLSAEVGIDLDGRAPAIQLPSGYPLEITLTREVTGALLEALHDISGNLRGLLRVEEERLNATVEQQGELLLVAKSIARTLAELADAAAL